MRLARIAAWLLFLFVPWDLRACDFPKESSQYLLQTWETDDGLPNNNVSAITQTQDGYLWMGTGAGLVRFDGTKFKVHPGTNKLGLFSSPIRFLTADRSGALWVVCESGTVARLEDGVLSVLLQPEATPTGSINSMVCDETGRAWISLADSRFIRWSPGGSTTFARQRDGTEYGHVFKAADKVLFTDARPVAPVNSARFVTVTDNLGATPPLLPSQRGSFWAICGNKLCQTTAGLKTVTVAALPWKKNANEGQVLFGSRRGVLFIGTRNCGLFRVEDGRLTRLPTSHHNIHAVFEDRDGDLWVGTASGLNRLRPRRPQMQGLEAGSLNGACGMHAQPPPVRIENIIINDNPIPYSDYITIPSPCRKVEIKYTAPCLPCPEKTRFRYLLEKVDTNWVEAGSQRVAIFSQLPPGDYKFRVTARNGASEWHPSGAAVSLTVKSNLLRNRWFQVAALLALIGSGHCLIQFRRWRQRMLFLEEERTRIAQDMHDHVGARLTHIALISEQARRESGLTPAVAEKIATISATTHEVARTLDEIVWAVEPSNDTVAGVIDYLSQYCSEYSAAADIQLKQDLPEKIPAGTIQSGARHNLVLAVKEALNNAIKHALASEIELRTELEPHKLRVQITDNGRGFLLEESRALGNGLGNMEKRLVTSGGRCQIDSRTSGGTKVTFELPLGKTGLILRPLLPKKQKGPVVGD